MIDTIQQKQGNNPAAHIIQPYFGIFDHNNSLFYLKDSQIILGIDPGTLVMGYGLICANKSNVSLIEMGVLQLSKYEDHAERLKLIFNKIQSLIQLHHPVAVAIEAPFFGKNVQSMLKLGRAQGVAIAAAMVNGLNAAEYAPRKVKQSITGRGNATKEQVLSMLQHTFGAFDDVRFMDATDAVAVALCHHYQGGAILSEKMPEKKIKSRKTTNWATFAALNPDRVK